MRSQTKTKVLFSIVIIASILALTILTVLHRIAEHRVIRVGQNTGQEDDVELDNLRRAMKKNVDTIDAHCRQLDRAELIEQQRWSIYLVKTAKQAQDQEKKEAQAKLQLAKQEKIIRDNVLYFPQLAQMWCLVPKAASTSWSTIIATSTLNRAKPHRNFSSQNASSIQVRLKEAFGHIGKIEYNAAVHSEKVLKVLLVRHPFARIISAYEDKLRDRQARYDGIYFFDQFGSPIHGKYSGRLPKREGEPTFTEFINYLINEDPMEYDEHWKPVSLLCGLCHVHYDVVIKAEEMKSDPWHSATLLRMLNFNSESKLPWLNRIQSKSLSAAQYFRRHKIARSKILRLYKKFEHDFQLFGYKLEDY